MVIHVFSRCYYGSSYHSAFHLSMKDEGKGLKALPTLILCQGFSLAIPAGDGAAQDKEILLPIAPGLLSENNSLQKGSIGVSHTTCSKDNYSQRRIEARNNAGQNYKPA